MTNSINARDVERLSSYLDGALNAGETRKLEGRLAAEPDLARALTRLKGARHLLRQAPQAQAPRAFTLTPEMIGQPENWLDRLPVSLNLVSAMATIMLAFVLLGDFLTPGGIVTYSDFIPSAAVVAESATGEEQTFALEAPEAAMDEAAPAEEAQLQAETESTGDEAQADGAGNAPSDEAQVLPPNTSGKDLEDQSAEDQGQRLIEEQIEQEPASIRRLHLFLLDAVLALIALVSGLGAWLQRRSS